MKIVAIAMAAGKMPPSPEVMKEFAICGTYVKKAWPESQTSIGLGFLKEDNEINILRRAADNSLFRNMGQNSVWSPENIRFLNKSMAYSGSSREWLKGCPDAELAVNLFLDACEIYGLEMLFKRVNSIR
jgi:hypothetical protein